jgi:hypothetical protein
MVRVIIEPSQEKTERESEAKEQNKGSHLAAESPRVKVEDLTHQRIRSELHLEALREKSTQRVQLNDGRPAEEFELVSCERSEWDGDRVMGEIGRARNEKEGKKSIMYSIHSKKGFHKELPRILHEKYEQD